MCRNGIKIKMLFQGQRLIMFHRQKLKGSKIAMSLDRNFEQRIAWRQRQQDVLKHGEGGGSSLSPASAFLHSYISRNNFRCSFA